MKQFQSIIGVLFTALLSTVIVFGAVSASSAEALLNFTVTPFPTTTEPERTQDIIPTNTVQALINTPFVQVITPSFTPTLINTSAVCPPPQNWIPYTIQPGDLLETLAEQLNISVDQLKTGNCLEIDSLIPGSVIYLPEPQVTATFTATATQASEEPVCGPPQNWVLYTVQSDDTLFELSIIFGVSIADLQEANCLGTSTLIKTGQQIYVPFLLVFTPTFTALPPTATTVVITTIAPTKTNTPGIIYTATPTQYWTPTSTQYLTPTSAFSPTATNTVATPTTTNTQLPSSTPTVTQTPTPTNTPLPGSTSTETPTLTPKP